MNAFTRYVPTPSSPLHPDASLQREAIKNAATWGDLLLAARAQWDWPIGSHEHSVLAAEVVVAKSRLMRGVNINETRHDGPITPGSFSTTRNWY